MKECHSSDEKYRHQFWRNEISAFHSVQGESFFSSEQDQFSVTCLNLLFNQQLRNLFPAEKEKARLDVWVGFLQASD
jgi:hypothetical protein